MNFEIGGSSVAADLMVYGFPKNTNAKGHIESEEIYPSKAWRAFRALFQNVEEKESEENVYNYVHKLTQNWFPEGNSLKDFSAEVQFQKSKWNIKDLRFNSYDGEIILRGEIDCKLLCFLISRISPGFVFFAHTGMCSSFVIRSRVSNATTVDKTFHELLFIA